MLINLSAAIIDYDVVFAVKGGFDFQHIVIGDEMRMFEVVKFALMNFGLAHFHLHRRIVDEFIHAF